jgi:hypothetical protein
MWNWSPDYITISSFSIKLTFLIKHKTQYRLLFRPYEFCLAVQLVMNFRYSYHRCFRPSLGMVALQAEER